MAVGIKLLMGAAIVLIAVTGFTLYMSIRDTFTTLYHYFKFGCNIKDERLQLN